MIDFVMLKFFNIDTWLGKVSSTNRII